MADPEIRDFLLPFLDAEDPVVIRMRHEPHEAAARLLVSLGAGWVVDESAPACMRSCGHPECSVGVSAHEVLRTELCVTPGCPRDASSGRDTCDEHDDLGAGVTNRRRSLAVEAARLRDEGFAQRDIVERLGLSRSYVSELLLDPAGVASRARKDGYRRPCPRCGSLMDGSNGTKAPSMCATCAAAAAYDERRWTRDEIIASFQEFARRFGRPPGAADAMGLPRSLRDRYSPERQAEIAAGKDSRLLPAPAIVQREFGFWKDALVAAGLPANMAGSPSHRSRKLGAAQQATLDLLADGPLELHALVRARGVRVETVFKCLTSLIKRGLVRNASRGVYARTDLTEIRGTDRAADVRPQQAGREPQDVETDAHPSPDTAEQVAPTVPVSERSSGPVGAEPGSCTAAPDPDDFPDALKDAYAVALIAAVRAFADTLEGELALR